MKVQDTRVVVLPDEDSKGGKGGLFERFVSKLLAGHYGFQTPTTRSLNVTSDGIELDVVATHKLTGSVALAECKAYSRNVAAHELMNFYGKLSVERLASAGAFGIFCALPRLTPEGEEKAREIQDSDNLFKYLYADELAQILLSEGLISDAPASIKDRSDSAVVITEHGIYGACITLDSAARTPTGIAVWAVGGTVPESVVNLIAQSDYASGLPVLDVGADQKPFTVAGRERQHILLTPVIGSSSDFEYQLPASPKFFVGRRAIVQRLEKVLEEPRGSVLVLNAQSGWGKSSLALKLQDLGSRRKGVTRVMDTRTADHPRYVVEVLRCLAGDAEEAGLLTLPDSASWASLESALTTFRKATWNGGNRPVVAFFDQFENVFRDVELTRAFRDLALGCRDIRIPLVVGFAWKTDLVGWTEGHPYQLRDDIRGAGAVVTVEPFGAKDVDVILQRLANEATVRLLPDLRSRLRAYSQGLPWLLKKLADHVLRELRRGETQEGLLAESLNVVTLFEADLAELNPNEHAVLRHVARFAPVSAPEVTDRFGPASVQSLVDRRLVVQVGDRLDTYWDTFRDFLNTGSVPVQESWILRQTPLSVGRLLVAVMEAGGGANVPELEQALQTSDRAIWNLSRELRLLGITAYEPNRVQLVQEVIEARDREEEMRRRVGAALRRHRAHTALKNLAERNEGRVTLDSYSRELPNVFPAVAVAKTAWTSYARAFLFWMEYAGLVVREVANYTPVAEPSSVPKMRLLETRSPIKYRRLVPQIAPGRALALLAELRDGRNFDLPADQKQREAVGSLAALGAVNVSADGRVTLAVTELVGESGEVQPLVLRSLLAEVPGGEAGLSVLEHDNRATPMQVGQAIAEAAGTEWKPTWVKQVGGYFRSWAKAAGADVGHPRRARV